MTENALSLNEILKKSKSVGETLRDDRPAVTVVGSFKFKDKIDKVIEEFEANGVQVLAPGRGRVVAEQEGFPMLDIDNPDTPWVEIEQDFVAKAVSSDAVYVVDLGAYVGWMSAIELGFITAHRIPIYCMERFDTEVVGGGRMWHAFAGIVKQYSPAEVSDMLQNNTLDTKDYPWCE